MNDEKRRWFQFHLSTIILLNFAAAGLLYVNLLTSTTVTPYENGRGEISTRGWPLAYEKSSAGYWGKNPHPEVAIYPPDNTNLALNIAIAAAVLAATAVASEFITRRREREGPR